MRFDFSPDPEARRGRVLVLAGILTATLAGFASTCLAQHAAPPAVTLADTSRVGRWRDDLRFIADRIRAQHPRPFVHCPEARFDSALRSIEARIAGTDDARLAAEAMRLVALLEDGHTQLIGTLPPLGFTSVLPVYLRPFEDGLHVIAADDANADAVGAKVTRVGEVTPEVALERVMSVTSGDNRYTRLDRVPLFFMMPGLLHALGISEYRDRLVLEVETPKRRRKLLTITGGAPPEGFPFAYLATEPVFPASWKSARETPAEGPPRCDRRRDDAWWFEDLPGTSTLYLRMARVERTQTSRPNAEDYRRFYQRLFAHADSARPATFVVDLRHDHGGNNGVVDPLVKGIAERPWMNRDGALFVLIDRGTFSAAMNAAVFLANQTRAIFVGEPTGGGLNHYGDAPEAHTPNLGMMLQVSTIPWLSRYPQDPRRWVAPEIAVPSTFAGWREGRDATLDAALAAAREGTRDLQVLAAWRKGGVDAAATALAEWERAHPNPWRGDRVFEITNSLAARLDRGEWESAVALGEALVKLEPQAAPAWRYAGEAQMLASNRARAVECLRQVLKLNPQASNSRRLLEYLGEKP